MQDIFDSQLHFYWIGHCVPYTSHYFSIIAFSTFIFWVKEEEKKKTFSSRPNAAAAAVCTQLHTHRSTIASNAPYGRKKNQTCCECVRLLCVQLVAHQFTVIWFMCWFPPVEQPIKIKTKTNNDDDNYNSTIGLEDVGKLNTSRLRHMIQ